MHRVLRDFRHLRLLVVFATFGAAIVLTAPPAAAGTFECRDNSGIQAWTCEITMNSLVVDNEEVIEYTCTALANEPPVALATGVSCYVAAYPGTTAAFGDATVHSAPGP